MYLLLQYIIIPQGMFNPHMLQKGDYKVCTLVKARFMDTRLTWTPHYLILRTVCFLLRSIGKGKFFSKFNPLPM